MGDEEANRNEVKRVWDELRNKVWKHKQLNELCDPESLADKAAADKAAVDKAAADKATAEEVAADKAADNATADSNFLESKHDNHIPVPYFLTSEEVCIISAQQMKDNLLRRQQELESHSSR